MTSLDGTVEVSECSPALYLYQNNVAASTPTPTRMRKGQVVHSKNSDDFPKSSRKDHIQNS